MLDGGNLKNETNLAQVDGLYTSRLSGPASPMDPALVIGHTRSPVTSDQTRVPGDLMILLLCFCHIYMCCRGPADLKDMHRRAATRYLDDTSMDMTRQSGYSTNPLNQAKLHTFIPSPPPP